MAFFFLFIWKLFDWYKNVNLERWFENWKFVKRKLVFLIRNEIRILILENAFRRNYISTVELMESYVLFFCELSFVANIFTWRYIWVPPAYILSADGLPGLGGCSFIWSDDGEGDWTTKSYEETLQDKHSIQTRAEKKKRNRTETNCIKLINYFKSAITYLFNFNEY